MISPVPLIKVTRNGRILWKHGLLLFSALMVRTVILEPILLYHASKYKKPEKTGLLRLLVNSHFSKNVAILRRNTLALYQIQNGGPN